MKKYALIFIPFLMQACTVGPDYVRPEAPPEEHYSKTKPAETFGTQKINRKKKIAENWWKEFSSPELDALIQKGINENPSLTSVKKDLEKAEEALLAEEGNLWPSISFDIGAGRIKYGAAFLGPVTDNAPPFTYYEIGPSLTYLIDIFGITRRAIENQRALKDYQKYAYEAARLTLTGNITTAALNIAILNAEIDSAKKLIEQDEQNLVYINKAYKLGAVTQNEVIAAKNQLSIDQTFVPKLELELRRVKNELTLLVGSKPSKWEPPNFQLSQFKLPKELPLTVPSVLARTRPDILAAESVVEAANAMVGVATANLFPNIVISGTYMQEALNPASLFQASSGAWNYMGNLTQPIFNGGALRAQKRLAERAYEGSLSNYQDVVVKALVQVNEALHALDLDAQSAQAGKRTMVSSKKALDLAKTSQEKGASNALDVLKAKRHYQEAKMAYDKVEGQRYLDTVQLYLVLGGRSPT